MYSGYITRRRDRCRARCVTISSKQMLISPSYIGKEQNYYQIAYTRSSTGPKFKIEFDFGTHIIGSLEKNKMSQNKPVWFILLYLRHFKRKHDIFSLHEIKTINLLNFFREIRLFFVKLVLIF